MHTTTPLYEVLDAKLAEHGGLEAFVTEARSAEKPKAWRRIANEIREITGWDVTEQTLRGWFA